jgi:ribosome-binding ATPase YchF (GTP1/OBG family)
MKIGLVGFAGSGKSTVFRWLTGQAPDPARVQFGQEAVAKVPDERLDALAAAYSPKKTTPAVINFLDTPGLLATERKDNSRRLGIIREGTGLLVVLDGFTGADAAAQLRGFREELLFADLDIITNRLERLAAQSKKSARPAKEKEADAAEQAVLEKVRVALEAGQPASTLGLKPEEELAIRSFQLLTLKPELVLVNGTEAGIGKALPADLLTLAPGARFAPCKLELELEDLADEDRSAFMADLGLTHSVRGEITRAAFYAMGRLVFLTAGKDECRAWALTRGSDAVAAAAAIHTGLADKMARARVVAFEDFKKVGFSEKDARTQGLERTEGKTYIVQDGDVIEIL